MQIAVKFVKIVGFAAALIGVLALTQGSTSALSGDDFNAGRIIDDSVFFNDSAISVPQIQQFLDSKVPTCDTNGTQPLGGTTRAAYGASQGYPAPYTCLKDYSQSISGVNNSSGDLCTGDVSSGTKSAAQIIYDVGKACGINPQVLIVMLQKEQSLVTDDWPWPSQYDKAMGYACPDSGPNNSANCDSAFFRFFNQVYNAAQAFKRYEANPNSYNYRANSNNSILYHPNTACGSSNVFIENQATANLYIYTPYQPNQAALDNLYGAGDSCSAYGNRNFWRLFNDWFGSTDGTPFFRINNSAAVYMLGADDTYYHVTSEQMLNAYGYPTVIDKIFSYSSSYVSGMTFSGALPVTARFEGSAIYLIDRGKRRQFPSQTLYEDTFGYTIGTDEAKLPAATASYYEQYSNMTELLTEYSGPGIYIVEDKKRRHITESAALQEGSPAYGTRAAANVTLDYILTLTAGDPVVARERLIRHTDTNDYSYWNGSVMFRLSSGIVAQLGLIPDTTIASTSLTTYNTSSTTVQKLAKSQTNQYFILDNNSKLLISSSDLTQLGLNTSSFPTLDNDLLNRVTTRQFTNIFRIDGSAAIYTIVNGDRKRFINPLAISSFGFNQANTIDIDSTTASLFTYSGRFALPVNWPIRLNGSPTVYITTSKTSKATVPSKSLFEKLNLSFDDVLNINSASASDYTSVGKVGYFIKKSSGQVWFLDEEGRRRHVPQSLLGSSLYNIDTNDVVRFSDTFISRIRSNTPLQEVITSSNTPRVYAVENGTKRWVTSVSTLSGLGYSTDDVIVVDQQYLDSLPNGANL